MSELVHARELSNLKMVEGNEDKYNLVVDDGVLKQWVGIGWIELQPATKSDCEKYPTVER